MFARGLRGREVMREKGRDIVKEVLACWHMQHAYSTVNGKERVV